MYIYIHYMLARFFEITQDWHLNACQLATIVCKDFDSKTTCEKGIALIRGLVLN